LNLPLPVILWLNVGVVGSVGLLRDDLQGITMDSKKTCEVCNRKKVTEAHRSINFGDGWDCHQIMSGLKKIRIVHDYAGCDTGCCGNSLILEFDDGRTLTGGFEYVHSLESLKYKANEVINQLKAKNVEIDVSEYVDE